MEEVSPFQTEGPRSERLRLLQERLPQAKVLLIPGVDIEKVRSHINAGRAALCVNTQKNEIYFGDGHLEIYHAFNIPVEDYLGAIAGIDRKSGAVVVADLWDWKEKDTGKLAAVAIYNRELEETLARRTEDYLKNGA